MPGVYGLNNFISQYLTVKVDKPYYPMPITVFLSQFRFRMSG